MRKMIFLLRESKHYILICTFIFLLGMWLGYVFFAYLHMLITPMLEQILEMQDDVIARDSLWYMTWVIFQNNVRASMLMIFVGCLLFFFPIFGMLMNGLMVGYVVHATATTGTSPAEMFVFGILPHGVLELPVVFIAGGLGLFFGIRILRWLFGRNQLVAHMLGEASDQLTVGQFWRERTIPVLKYRLQALGMMLIALIVILFVSAVIESFVTPVLIERFVDLP